MFELYQQMQPTLLAISCCKFVEVNHEKAALEL